MNKAIILPHHIKLHPHMVENIQLIIEGRFHGMKAYCIKRNIDIAAYWASVKYGAFPHEFIAYFLVDDILNQSGYWFWISYEDLVDCARQRLLKETTPEQFCHFYNIQDIDYLKFFNKFIFNGHIYTSLLTAGYWKDQVALLHDIPSDILNIPNKKPEPKTAEDHLEIIRQNLIKIQSIKQVWATPSPDLSVELADKKKPPKKPTTEFIKKGVEIPSKRDAIMPPPPGEWKPGKDIQPDLELNPIKRMIESKGELYTYMMIYLFKKYPSITVFAKEKNLIFSLACKHFAGTGFSLRVGRIIKEELEIPAGLLKTFYYSKYPNHYIKYWKEII